jgi:hypothetical protein
LEARAEEANPPSHRSGDAILPLLFSTIYLIFITLAAVRQGELQRRIAGCRLQIGKKQNSEVRIQKSEEERIFPFLVSPEF